MPRFRELQELTDVWLDHGEIRHATRLFIPVPSHLQPQEESDARAVPPAWVVKRYKKLKDYEIGE